jgi:RimJ/RimL family protein N-acetyltransferase
MLQFSRLQEKDMDYIFELLNEENIIKVLYYPKYKYDELVKWFNIWNNDDDEINFIIKINNIPIGWIKINGLKNSDKAYLSGLIISTNHQTKGYGKESILFVEKYVIERGFIKLGIRTTEDNIKAKSLYLKSGYKIIEKRMEKMENGNNIITVRFEKQLLKNIG